MDERNSAEKQQGKERSLDERLTAYYGPALPEQPLPASSWLRLHSQAGSRRPSHSRMMRRWHFRRLTSRGRVPPFVQGAFSRITYEARLPFGSSILHTAIRSHTRLPEVHVSLLRKRHIRLSLPSALEGTVESHMLDVLLATGLARYLSMRRRGYMLPRLLLCSVVLFAYIGLALLYRGGLSVTTLLIAMSVCGVLSVLVLWILDRQRRVVAVRADSLMAQWLGRERACRGLHALAERSRAPSRRRWGELSLVERIARVCGTQVQLEQERLTLVR